MFDHIGIFVTDFEKSVSFYEACLGPLGIKIYQRQPEFSAVVFAGDADCSFLWMGAVPEGGDYHGTPVSREEHRPMHLSFIASSEDSVNEFYRLGLKHGGRDNGAPEYCGYGYYAAYLLDPDGNNIEAGIRK
ncbi:MAG: VOC family protein [Verrucomicrobiales bacterium]|nr:VOC family protein [Verrucomicrobiales bacterium]